MIKIFSLIGLILIIVGIFPILMLMIGLGAFAFPFYIFGIFNLSIAGFVFSEMMLIFIGLGIVFTLFGIVSKRVVSISRGYPQIILGIVLIIIFLLTVTVESIPIIWTGAAFTGTVLLISGIRDVVHKNNTSE